MNDAEFQIAAKLLQLTPEKLTEILKSSTEENCNKPEWLTRQEAAQFARVSTDTIDTWIKRQFIKANKLAEGKAGGVRIYRASLDSFLLSRCKKKARKRQYAPSVPGGYRVSHKREGAANA